MFGQRIILGNKGKDEAEKPFWISFADLMSALMVLFLLVMSVALLAVTKKVSEAERKVNQRTLEISQLLEKIEKATKDFPGVSLDKERHVINFGTYANFEDKKYNLENSQILNIRNIVSNVVLKYADDELGKKWFKKIIVAGFTSRTGTYLYNLNLSLNRSQKVLCVLLTNKSGVSKVLNDKELEQVRDLFFIGGYSFNDTKETEEESRRIELALEFYGVDEEHTTKKGNVQSSSFGDCKI